MNAVKIERPAIVRDEHLAYLDRLMAEGKVAMADARFHLKSVFSFLNRGEARIVVRYWKSTRTKRS